MSLDDVIFSSGPDLNELQRVIVEANVGARPVDGGVLIPGGQAAIEAEAVVFRSYFAPDLLPSADANEGDNTLNLQLQTGRALHLNGALVLDHMVRADAGVPRETLLAALRAFTRDVDQIAGRPIADAPPTASDGMDVPNVVAALTADGLAAQPSPESGFVVAEHEEIRFLMDLTQASRATFAAYFDPPEGERTVKLAFANHMNGRYGLARTKFDAQGHMVVDYPLVRGGGFVPASFASTARFFAVAALRVRQAAMAGWTHTPLPN